MKYINNDIVKTFRVGILHCYEHVQNINDLAKYLTSLSTKGGITTRHIGPPATNNSLSMRLALQLGMDLIHPFRMNYMTKVRTIITYLMNNGVTLCPLCNLKIIVKGVRPRSRGFQPPIQSSFILISTTILGCCIIRRRVLVSYLTANNIVKDPQSSRGSALFCSLHKDINL